MKHTFRRKRVKTVRTAFRATRMNAYIERFIRTLRNEVLDHSKRRRKAKPPDTISLNDVRCEQKLGGLLKSYK